MRLVLTILVLVAALVGLAIAVGPDVFSHRAESRTFTEVSREAAASAEEKLRLLENEGEEARLSGAELTSLLRYHPEVWALGGVVTPAVAIRGDTLAISGAVSTDRLPEDPALDAVRLFLPDTTQVDLTGTIRMSASRSVIFEIASVEVATMPVPPQYVPVILDRLGLPQRDDLPPHAFALPLPSNIRSARVEQGLLVLSP